MSETLSLRLSEQVILSTEHYYADCGLFLQAENVLFVVSEAMLCSRSFSIISRLAEARAVNPLAGHDQEHAILLENVAPRELTHFFDYLWGDRRVYANHEEPEVENLVDILRLSELFGVASGKTFAIHFLEEHGDLPETQRLMISLKYQLDSWFKSSLVWLVRWPLSNWTPTEVELIDKELFLQIVETQTKIHSHRCLRALDAPTVVTGCDTPEQCLSNWHDAWKRFAGPVLVRPYTEYDVYDDVRRALAETTGVCEKCSQAFLHLVDSESSAEKDEIEQFAVDMMRLHHVSG